MNVSTGGSHILLFERDQQLAALLTSELQLAGYECHVARTAVEVFDAIARHQVRLVLVNLAQAAAGRREFWVALDTQRRGRGVQVLTYRCANVAGYGPRDPEEAGQPADLEVDGMMGIMRLVDAARARLPQEQAIVQEQSAAAPQAPYFQQPTIPLSPTMPHVAQSPIQQSPYASQPSIPAMPAVPPASYAAPPPQSQPSPASPVYTPAAQQPPAQPPFAAPPPPSPARPQPQQSAQNAAPASHPSTLHSFTDKIRAVIYPSGRGYSTVPQQEATWGAQNAGKQELYPASAAPQSGAQRQPPPPQPQPIQPRAQPPTLSDDAEEQRYRARNASQPLPLNQNSQSLPAYGPNAQASGLSQNSQSLPAYGQNSQPLPAYEDQTYRARNVSQPLMQSQSSQPLPAYGPNAQSPALSQNSQPLPAYGANAQSPALNQNSQPLPAYGANAQAPAANQNSQPLPAYGPNAQGPGLSQNSQPLPAYGQNSQPLPATGQNQGAQPQYSPDDTYTPRQRQAADVDESSLAQLTRLLEEQFGQALAQAKERQQGMQSRPAENASAPPSASIPLRPAPIQGLSPELEQGYHAERYESRPPTQQPPTQAAAASELNSIKMVVPPVSPNSGPLPAYRQEPAAQPAPDQSLLSHTLKRARSEMVEETAKDGLYPDHKQGAYRPAEPQGEEPTSENTLLTIMQSLPPMEPAPPPPVLNGRATRALGSVLLEGHLVPQDRLEVAQNVQRMLRGVDLNYQLGEILLMFKLLTPDQLLAASLVSYGLITTSQIRSLGRIRQELHSMGLEYDLENLIILFRILTPEQLREVRASWSS